MVYCQVSEGNKKHIMFIFIIFQPQFIEPNYYFVV
jgi:hypothetical protein